MGRGAGLEGFQHLTSRFEQGDFHLTGEGFNQIGSDQTNAQGHGDIVAQMVVMHEIGEKNTHCDSLSDL
jgi:hypothetical protein